MWIAALDIGGTKMAATMANADGPVARVVRPTAKSGHVGALAKQAVDMIREACAQAGQPPQAVTALGVSSCGPFVLREDAISLSSPNLCGGLPGATDLPNDWVEIPLEQVLREQFPRVVVRNDCVAALTGERVFGAVVDEPNCVYVTWSTGIGFGICVDGHVLQGKNGNAGHAGHLLMSEASQALCGCGNYGDVEALVSGRNIERRHGRSSADIFKAAHDGDAQFHAIVTEAAQWFGKALYNLAVTLDTSTFVIGGSVWAHHGGWLLPLVQHEIDSRLPALTKGVAIRDAALGSFVADIGALCLVMPAAWIEGWRRTQPWLSLR